MVCRAIPRNSLKRIGRKANVSRISIESLDEAIQVGEEFFLDLFSEAKVFMENEKRTTLLDRDIRSAWRIIKNSRQFNK